jgi:hypothetical protein
MIIPSASNKCGPPEVKKIFLTEHRVEWLESLLRFSARKSAIVRFFSFPNYFQEKMFSFGFSKL